MNRQPPLTPLVPKEFITAPVFAATRQTQPRTLQIDGVSWTIGAPRPDRRALSPPFDIRHGRLSFALLTFRDRLFNGREIRFSINELAHRMANSNGGKYTRALLALLFDLRDTWIKLEYPDGLTSQFSVIESLRVNSRPARRADALAAVTAQGELWIDFVNLSPEFFGLMQRIEKLGSLRLDVLNSLDSPIAQSIYTYLPSRAVHRQTGNPFEITLSTIMQQIGLAVPPHKSIRKKVFTQNKTPIIDQLNGAETLAGTLRVDLAETNDRADYKLRSWVDKPAPPPTPDGALLRAWLQSGRTAAQYEQRARCVPLLADHHVYLLRRAGAVLDGNERFFRLAGALLGVNRLDTLLSEAKGDAIEGRQARNPTACLIWRIIHAVENLPPPENHPA